MFGLEVWATTCNKSFDVEILKLLILTPIALRGPFWAFGVFGQGPPVSILLRFL